MSEVTLLVSAATLFVLSVELFRRHRSACSVARLQNLVIAGQKKATAEPLCLADLQGEELLLESFGDRLGKAGYLSHQERRKARVASACILTVAVILGSALGMKINLLGAILSGIGAAYLGCMSLLFYLGAREREVQRDTLFRLPIILESIILLVESGLGILPALERVVQEDYSEQQSVVGRVLGVTHSLVASGMPFTQALEIVSECVPQKTLRHVLLHLDISGTEGGELVPSLRNLSEYVHNEWKLSVETRVKRLENIVVFPVFASVMGLLLLTAAVPLVPVLDFMDSLDAKRPQAITELRNPVNEGSR